MSRSTTAALSAMLAIVLASCASSDTVIAGEPEMAPVVVRVLNDTTTDVEIHFLRSDAWILLGKVSKAESARFRLPDEVITTGTVRLMIGAVGGKRSYITDLIQFEPATCSTGRSAVPMERP